MKFIYFSFSEDEADFSKKDKRIFVDATKLILHQDAQEEIGVKRKSSRSEIQEKQ